MMTEKVSKSLDEKYYVIDHKSGLKIYVMPKENYSSTYAIFGTNYGSIDTKFKRSDKDEWTVVPEGIAHFLEHKLFESEDLDAFARYAKTGASANAYTSFDRTCYLFQCSDNFEASLEILLDFVTHPYFTKETVEKEQGIIGQEITMYYDIAGTVESISQITDKLLYDCYDTFYNLNNMALAVVGNVDVEQVLSVCDKMLKSAPNLSIERSFEKEDRDVAGNYTEYNLAMSIPVFSFGYKEECAKPKQDLKTIIETTVLLEILAGNTSNLYNSLFKQGLINENFSKEYFIGYGYEAIIFDGESENPKEVASQIKKEVARLKKEGISDEEFEAVRRSLYGKEIMSYNDIDTIANGLISAHFGEYDIFDTVEIFKNIKKSDVLSRLDKVMDEKYSALSVVKQSEE